MCFCFCCCCCCAGLPAGCCQPAGQCVGHSRVLLECARPAAGEGFAPTLTVPQVPALVATRSTLGLCTPMPSPCERACDCLRSDTLCLYLPTCLKTSHPVPVPSHLSQLVTPQTLYERACDYLKPHTLCLFPRTPPTPSAPLPQTSSPRRRCMSVPVTTLSWTGVWRYSTRASRCCRACWT